MTFEDKVKSKEKAILTVVDQGLFSLNGPGYLSILECMETNPDIGGAIDEWTYALLQHLDDYDLYITTVASYIPNQTDVLIAKKGKTTVQLYRDVVRDAYYANPDPLAPAPSYHEFCTWLKKFNSDGSASIVFPDKKDFVARYPSI